jgi:hypothetical protein
MYRGSTRKVKNRLNVVREIEITESLDIFHNAIEERSGRRELVVEQWVAGKVRQAA